MQRSSYDTGSIIFHWLIGILILGLIVVGWYMGTLPRGPERTDWVNLHKSFGTIVLFLVALRIVWRSRFQKKPEFTEPPKQRKIVEVWHILLYVFITVMPLSGFLASNFNRGIIFFGVALPPLFEPNKPVARFFNEVHEISAWIITILVVGHIAAALWHRVVKKDDVLQRMLPTKNSST
jgi:cytochrome b561